MSDIYKPHAVAEIFPMMSDEQYATFKADIEIEGVQSVGLLYQGKILDGRNRYRACQELGLTMDWSEVEQGDEEDTFDPVQYVISHNLHRRHLTDQQRAGVAAKLATLKNGNTVNQKSAPQSCGAHSVAEAASLLNVSPRKVEQAKRVQRDADPIVVQQVERDELPLTTAEKLVKRVTDKNEQSKLAKQGKKAINEHIKQLESVEPPAVEKPKLARKHLPDLVSAFRRSDTKADDLKVLVEDMDESYRQLLRDWLK